MYVFITFVFNMMLFRHEILPDSASPSRDRNTHVPELLIVPHVLPTVVKKYRLLF